MTIFFSFLVIFSFILLITGLIKPSLVIRWGAKEKRGRKQVVIIYNSLLLFSMLMVGGMSNNKPVPAPTQTQMKSTAQPLSPGQSSVKPAPAATLPATVNQFVETYNKEIKQRYGEKSVLGPEKPMRAGVAMYDIPDGKASILTLSYQPSDKKLTNVTFVVQGEPGEKFEVKTRRAWIASIISAISPGISNDDIIEIRAKLMDNTPVTKNGIFYMIQYEEKGAPFFNLIARVAK